MDAFCAALLEEAKRFLEKSRVEQSIDGQRAYLHAALYLSSCSLEGYVNSISDDFLTRGDMSVHERAFLAEKEVRLTAGKFTITDTLKMARLEDRISFLCARYGGVDSPKAEAWWGDFKAGVDLRNDLTHPKKETIIDIASVERFLLSVIELLDYLFFKIYKKRFPAKARLLNSKFSF